MHCAPIDMNFSPPARLGTLADYAQLRMHIIDMKILNVDVLLLVPS